MSAFKAFIYLNLSAWESHTVNLVLQNNFGKEAYVFFGGNNILNCLGVTWHRIQFLFHVHTQL